MIDAATQSTVSRSSIRVTTYDGPGTDPVMREVPWPKVPPKGALIQIGACGVCGTDQHILKGHWPKPLPWPFTLGHELAGVIVEIGSELKTDHMGKTIGVGSKLMLPPLMPCGFCDWCKRYPEQSNKCPQPVYYGRYLGFDRPPHLWGGWAEYVYVDLGELPGTKIYKLPDDMSLLLGSLSEPLTSCIRAFNRATKAGGFTWGDTVVIQGTGPIGILAIAAAQEMGAGRVIAVGAPENPRLALAREFGAEATVDIERHTTPEARIKAVRDIVGGWGADVVMDCSGHPTAGPEGIEFLRDGGTYVETLPATALHDLRPRGGRGLRREHGPHGRAVDAGPGQSILATMKILGVTLIAASLVIPATVARMLTNSFSRMLWMSSAIGAFSGFVGMNLSYHLDVQSGPTIVLVAATLFGIVFMATGPLGRRGLRLGRPL